MRRGLNGPKSKQNGHTTFRKHRRLREREDHAPSRPDVVIGLTLICKNVNLKKQFLESSQSCFSTSYVFFYLYVLHLHTFMKLYIILLYCSLVVSYLTSREACKQATHNHTKLIYINVGRVNKKNMVSLQTI